MCSCHVVLYSTLTIHDFFHSPKRQSSFFSTRGAYKRDIVAQRGEGFRILSLSPFKWELTYTFSSKLEAIVLFINHVD